MKQPISAPDGAPPKGPYTPAILASGPTLYISAQGPVDPQTGEVEASTFEAKAVQVFENIGAQLRAAGATWHNVVKITVFLRDMGNFDTMNEIYARYAKEPFPTRTTAQSNIGHAEIFVDCIAVLDS